MKTYLGLLVLQLGVPAGELGLEVSHLVGEVLFGGGRPGPLAVVAQPLLTGRNTGLGRCGVIHDGHLSGYISVSIIRNVVCD